MVMNVKPADAWDILSSAPDAWLVDVRTPAEWAYVGGPDLSDTGSKLLRISWHLWPQMEVNPAFMDQFDQQARSVYAKLFFLCRSGGRSLAAAQAVAEAGRRNVFNILHGFEGDLDDTGRRGNLNGWKASGLPWRQT